MFLILSCSSKNQMRIQIMLQSFYMRTVQTNGKFITNAEIDDIAFGKPSIVYAFPMMLIFSLCKVF